MSYPAPSPKYLGPPHRTSSGDNKPITRIVLHGTVSPTQRGGARQIAAYFRSSAAGGSAHYVVDPGEVVQVGWDSTICWHAPPNAHSIGVELCDWVGGGASHSTPLPLSRWNDEPHTQMLARAARLVAELCLSYRVPAEMRGPAQLRQGLRGICEHSDVSAAWRQSSHWDLGNFPRRRFARMVRREIEAIRNRVPATHKRSRLDDIADRIEQAARSRRAAKQRVEHAASPRAHHTKE